MLLPMETFDVTAGRLAARQLGLVTRAEAMRAGATERVIQHRLASGRWVRVGPGVYRLAGVPVTWHQRALAACLGAGPGAVVSHRSAAAVWGLSGFRPGPLEITVPSGRSGRSGLATVHRTLDLPAADRATHNRLPVTRPARTLIDLAGRVSAALLEEAVDDVLCRRLATLDVVHRRVELLSRHRGVAALATILAAWRGDATPANVAEMRVQRLLLESGFTTFVPQYEIVHQGQFVARVDLGDPDHRVAIDLDSFRWHAGRGPFRSDRARGNRIAAAGWTLLRATPEDAADGRAFLRALRHLVPEAA